MAETKKSNFVTIIEEICEEEGFSHASFSGNWCHRIEKDGRRMYIVGYQFPLNPGASRELCQDKVLTYEVLSAAGVPAVPHYFLCRPAMDVPSEKKAALKMLRKMLKKEGKAVLKDNYGTGGNRVFLVEHEGQFEEVLQGILTESYAAALSEYQEILEEYRVVVLNGRARFVFRKQRAYSLDEAGNKIYENWRHNLGQGATAVPVGPGALADELYAMAEKTVSLLNMGFCSVDIVETAAGFRVLEVNAGVMMEHLAGQSEALYGVAKNIYREAVLTSLGIEKEEEASCDQF